MTDTSKYAPENFDEGASVPNSSYFKFGKIGNVIKGKLIAITEQPDGFAVGQMRKVYHVEAIGGVYNNIVDKVTQPEETELTAGEVYKVQNKHIEGRMRTAAIGDTVTLRYVADFKADKGTAKTIDVKIVHTEDKPF